MRVETRFVRVYPFIIGWVCSVAFVGAERDFSQLDDGLISAVRLRGLPKQEAYGQLKSYNRWKWCKRSTFVRVFVEKATGKA